MKPISEIKLAAKLDNLLTLMESVISCAGENGISDNKTSTIELVVEEAFVNICKYAYPEGNGDVEVRCGIDNANFIIEIIDWGIPFDITSLPDPDITQDMAERKIGGLGVYLIKKFAEDIRYRREDDRNVLDIIIAAAHDKL